MAEATLRVYADATALIDLGRIGRLDLLAVFPLPIHVTTRVWQEVAEDLSKPGVAALTQARGAGILVVVQEGDEQAFPHLDAGESTVLSAAAAARAAVLIDERRARAQIRSDPALGAAIRQATGVVGLLLLARRRGMIPALRPLLDELILQNFWISPAFY